MNGRERPPRRLLHVFPTFAVGGSQMRFGQLVGAHGPRYRHTVLSLDGHLEMAGRLPPGAKVECLASGREGSGLVGPVRAARQRLRALKPDLLVTYNWGAMNWCLANRLAPLSRHIHIEDGFGPQEQDRQFRRRIWTRRLALGGGHTTVVVPSQNLLRIARTIWKLPEASVQYIPNGIDCARFGRLPEPHDGLVIGTVATLRREKNLERLIEAFAALAAERPDIRLVIVGDGAERGRLEEAARRSGHADRITFTGASATPEIYLAKMDIFALSSDTEQMPLSVLEAMAAGLPVASFAVGDVPAMVSPENRQFVSMALSDEGAYRAALKNLAASAELRARLGEANRRRAVADFDEAVMAERYAALFG